MGWSSGSDILFSVWNCVRQHIPSGRRAEVLSEVMHIFADEDCDTLDEVSDCWPEGEKAYQAFLEE